MRKRAFRRAKKSAKSVFREASSRTRRLAQRIQELERSRTTKQHRTPVKEHIPEQCDLVIRGHVYEGVPSSLRREAWASVIQRNTDSVSCSSSLSFLPEGAFNSCACASRLTGDFGIPAFGKAL